MESLGKLRELAENKPGARPTKKERLAAKLRENLRRRKDQAKERGLDVTAGRRGAFKALDDSGESNK